MREMLIHTAHLRSTDESFLRPTSPHHSFTQHAMKKNKPASALNRGRTLRQEPDVPSDSPDSVVDDLAQQDVMPAGEGVIVPDDRETLTGAMTQAGHWDDLVVDLGHRVDKQPLEDEVMASEDLVQKGVDEADEELRELDEEDNEEEEEEDIRS